MQRSIICPHCHTVSNHGVRVCVGCQAEAHYGASKEAVMLVVVAAIICGALVGSRLQATAGWVTCGAVLVAGMWAISRLFCDRVVFKRVYRTR
ncbi:TPA: hypothetical protein ACOEPG_002525 [Stenotrophomonas maltophilia]|uniref:Transmembrane protein n=2 Tax=Lysobacteraceae TaxID=32033 RepID=A0AAJ2TK49_STEMA|nr:hypothetical protein [Stenotrophomonas maltophilia]MBH1482948.1 hypothetical protein [Stenotrophomonas maltophilia]MCU1065228.1 hypothetical protein [Stenotrophomonas maltophilia]MDZ5763793.1 hypothetical protein [Stenotrophomonas maltophilia]